jgi:hypothetical protein
MDRKDIERENKLTLSRCLEEEIKETSREIQRALEKKRGWVNRLIFRLRRWFSRGPRREIYHDWLFAHTFYHRTLQSLGAKAENAVTAKEKSVLATIYAYLELASCEKNFAHCWSYVNLAITHLALVVEEEDLLSFTYYLTEDDKKEIAKKDNTHLAEDLDDNKLNAKLKNSVGINLDKKQLHLTVNLDPLCPQGKSIDRNRLHALLAKESYDWNEKNSEISLKLSLWKSVGSWFFFSLLCAVFIAENIALTLNLKLLFPYSYGAIAVLGFFGGGLSSLLKVREAVVNIPNSALIRAHTILRMLLGAAGAFVVYVIVQWQPLQEISGAIATNPAFFLTLGITAGFSERLFINALEKISENLSEKKTPEKKNGKQ